MTDDPLYGHLRQQGWRRKLTAEEQAQLNDWLAAHPEARADWEAETCLNTLLARVTDVPVPSNFTSRVLQAVAREETVAQPGQHPLLRFSFRWAWAISAIALTLLVCLLSFRAVENSRLQRVSRSLLAVSPVTTLPSLDVLTNFDVICALDRTPPPDEELLKALQ
jgi:hypothetical protein